MTHVLITGINGFIGSSFAVEARSRGWTITGTDLGPSDLLGTSDHYISFDLASLHGDDLVAAVGPVDRILHAGGISGFMVATDEPARIVATNVAGAMALFALARRCRCRLVLCSTIMVYGPDPEGVAVRSEVEYPRPISIYGASKLAVEGLMHGFGGQYGVDAVALRFSHVYGPGRTTECFVRTMLQAAGDGRPCVIPQAGASPRQYIHIDDVCAAIALAMDAESVGSRVFNVSAGEAHSLAEVAAAIGALTGGLQVAFDESRDLPNYRVGRLSIARARDELGYAPRWPLKDGLRRYWESSFPLASAGQRR